MEKPCVPSHIPNLDGQSTLGRVLLVPNFCTTVLFGNFKAAETVRHPSPNNPVSEVYGGIL